MLFNSRHVIHIPSFCIVKLLCCEGHFSNITLIDANSQGFDVSNFTGSDQKVASYQLVIFEVMTPKSDFLLIGVGTIAFKGSMNTVDFGKTPLFVE